MSKILGVKIDDYSFREVTQKITEFLSTNKFHQIATVNPEFIVTAQKDSDFLSLLNNTDLNIPDGFGLKCAGFIKRVKIGERITGVDLTWEIAKIAAEKGYSIYLLGGKKGVAKMTAKRLQLLYHNIKIAGTCAGSPEEEGIVEKINNTKADILLVAFGAPKQDKFIYHHKKQLECKLAMGVGGTFDYISGVLPRAPKWMRTLGLEWLYRLIIQPSRFKRIYTAIIKFPFLVIFSKKNN